MRGPGCIKFRPKRPKSKCCGNLRMPGRRDDWAQPTISGGDASTLAVEAMDFIFLRRETQRLADRNRHVAVDADRKCAKIRRFKIKHGVSAQMLGMAEGGRPRTVRRK